MSDIHQLLFDEALEAIQELFGDKSVSQKKTIDSLENLAAEIEISIEVIKEDLRRDAKDSETSDE